MGNLKDVLWLDATAQAELIQNGDISSLELVDEVIEAIEAKNPQLNAVITPMFDLARQDAKGELPAGPFTGVPFLMKDIGASVKGVRMAMGSELMKMFIPDAESELTTRLRKTGLVFVGKTNTPEFGLLLTTEPLAFGPTHNPWDLSRSPGGSSGGSAAAVASGITAMAHANDGGGSIRIPASCCGVFGLKPTRARNPLGPSFGDIMSGLVCEHAVTRSVRDSAALLDATAGPSKGDPYWAPPQARPYADEVNTDPGRLRIAFSTRKMDGTGIDPQCEKAVCETVALLKDLGHRVEEAMPEISFAHELVTQCFTAIWCGGFAATIDGISMLMGSQVTDTMIEPLSWSFYELGKNVTAAQYLNSVTVMQRIHRDIAHFHKDYDLTLTSVLATPPAPLGTFDPKEKDLMAFWQRAADYSPYTAITNATGQPAMSVPLCQSDQNLPIGMHFTASLGDEATLFRLAAQLEKARPWKDRRPAFKKPDK